MSCGSRLIIDEAVVRQFALYAQHKPYNREAGGLLLGRHLLGSEHIAVDDLSVPMRGDRRRRCSFFRGKGHQGYAHKRWNQSQGTSAYLGNWHTHPEPYPSPSTTDIADWKNVVKNDLYEGDRLYFLIVGTRELACWEGSAATGSLTRLSAYHNKQRN